MKDEIWPDYYFKFDLKQTAKYESHMEVSLHYIFYTQVRIKRDGIYYLVPVVEKVFGKVIGEYDVKNDLLECFKRCAKSVYLTEQLYIISDIKDPKTGGLLYETDPNQEPEEERLKKLLT